LAITRTLQVVKELKGIDSVRTGVSKGLDISIVGHNDFYSQRAQLENLGLPRRLDSLKKIQPFVPLGVSIEEVHKTGMGSSAALITSLVGALLVHFEAVDPTKFSETNDKGLRLVHNVAQYIHCLAQGKVGSGFDVASAIFGTHVYTRFDPSVITSLMDSAVGDRVCMMKSTKLLVRRQGLLYYRHSPQTMRNGTIKLSPVDFLHTRDCY
jgi:phosphomevalonate kinase